MFRNNAGNKRSPIKVKPLRDPGESLRRRLDDVLMEDVFPWVAIVLLVVIWAAVEWFLYFIDAPRSPGYFSVVAVVAIVMAYRSVRPVVSKARDLRQGLEGERAVGQFLEGLRAHGYQVFHDIEQEGYNIDHVLVGPRGVFAIETKTISKPTDRDAQIVYDGQSVLVDGHAPDRDPLKQADAGANRIRDIIEERTVQGVHVQPVVLYPGWYIRRCCRSPRVWVLNEKYLPGWLDQVPETLAEADVKRYGAVIADYVRGRDSD